MGNEFVYTDSLRILIDGLTGPLVDYKFVRQANRYYPLNLVETNCGIVIGISDHYVNEIPDGVKYVSYDIPLNKSFS